MKAATSRRTRSTCRSNDTRLTKEELRLWPCKEETAATDRTGTAATATPPPVRKRARALDPNDVVDTNDVEFLRRFVTEYGKIIPARLTGVTAAQQRQIKQGVRRARNMGLLA